MSGCSRFIEGQNVISAKIVPKKWTGEKMNFSYKQATSFPGSLFSASIVVTMEAEKRDPGNEVDKQEYLKKNKKKNILL